MRRNRLVWLLVLAAVILVVAGAVAAVRRGFSARDQPSTVESYVALTARKLAVPSKAKSENNPFAAVPEVMANVIHNFQEALERHDVAAISALVSEDVVVLENGHRNDGRKDFRDNHLIPEFKEPQNPPSGICEGRNQSRDGVGVYETDPRRDRERRQARRVPSLVCLRLQKTGPTWKVVLLDGSVRQLGPAD